MVLAMRPRAKNCKMSGNESENTKYGKIEINITKDILPDQKIAYKFVTTICPAGKVRYRGKISFSFKSPGSKSTLSMRQILHK